MEEAGYIEKKKIFSVLKRDYNLYFTERSLRNYVVEELIEPPFIDRVKGVVGSVSFYNINTPAMIYLTKWLRKVKAKLTFEVIRKYFSILKFEDSQELERLIEAKDLEARIDRLDLIYIGFFRALAELDILKKANLMSAKEIKRYSFGRIVKDPLVENIFELLDQMRCKITKDYILIKLKSPVERTVFYRESGIEIK